MKIQTSVAYGQSKEVGIYAVAAVVNALAAEGVRDYNLQIRILIPMYAFKSRMHTMEKFLKKVCEEQGIVLREIKSERSNVITQSMVIVTGCGLGVEETECEITPGQDIVFTGWIGLEGMLRIADEKEQELKKRFSTSFLKKIVSYKSQIFAEKTVCCAKEYGVKMIRQLGDGGVFAGLWNLAKETQCGLEVELKKIPVLQETVEVCELFRLNPYQLTSAGTMMMVTEDGEKLVEELNANGIAAVVVGRLTDSNDKILKNGEEIRYIDRPVPDEIMKIFEQEISGL